ncbi:MAG: HD domain-containing phosphohydrolase [Deltaproteobacteria bacterium]|nr:HD domain-containing phosphohydrolase [Deltaproteobacteria bacterium]
MLEVDLSLERLLFNLNTLAELGEEITSPKDFTRVVKSSLYMVMGSFAASKGAIFQYDSEDQRFNAIAAKGLSDIKGAGFKLSKEAVKEIVKFNKPIDLKGDPAHAALLGPAKAELEKASARVLAFLVVKDELLGVISINEKFSGQDYTVYDFQLLSVMAQHISFSLHSHTLLTKLMHKYTENKGLYENLRRIYYDTIHAFAAAIDAKDAYTKGHSHRVSAYCTVVAREMGWSPDEIEGIRISGLLHDIGKIAVDKSIINKASPLTSNECRELNSHPVIGYEILSKIKFPWKGIPMMTRNHHEKVDGTGYPDRLKKAEIPLGARIMALVDAFDAMTTDRPYRPRLSFKEAMDEVRENFGKQFDPEVVQPFISVIRKEVLGEVENPSIVPLLQEHLDSVTVNRLLEGFPGIS